MFFSCCVIRHLSVPSRFHCDNDLDMSKLLGRNTTSYHLSSTDIKQEWIFPQKYLQTMGYFDLEEHRSRRGLAEEMLLDFFVIEHCIAQKACDDRQKLPYGHCEGCLFFDLLGQWNMEIPGDSHQAIFYVTHYLRYLDYQNSSIRGDLKLDDAEGIYCLPTATIFSELERMGKDSAPTEPVTEETPNEAHVSTPSYDLPQSGKDSMQFSELMNLCTSLQEKVLNLEKANTVQAKDIASLNKRVKQLEKRMKLKTLGLKRLRKISSTSRVKSSNDASLGAQEDASKQERKIADLDADAVVTLEKVDAEKEVSAADLVTTAGEVVTTANAEVTTINSLTTTIDELTLGQTMIEIKETKPKAITSAATTTTTTRPKARGVVVQVPTEFKTTSSSLQTSQLPQVKDKGKGIMVDPEVPLKKKDQIAIDEEVARNLEAQLQAELEEEERLARQKEEEANTALLESWDNTQAMMDDDFQLAQQTQTEEQEQLSIEEKSKLFVEHFTALRDQEKRKMFDKEMKRVNTFIDMNTKFVKGSKIKVEGSSKGVGDELEQEKAKKQKGNDDQKEEEIKKHIEIVKDDEVAIDAIPLATKPLVIIEDQIDKDGIMRYFKLIRADGISKRYSTMIKML
ncbi:hypothetical protein Tco_1236536 [Tanacetum coccineum]